MNNTTHTLVQTILNLPLFHAEWVLWLLIVLSLASIAVMIERWVFYKRRTVDVDAIRSSLAKALEKGDMQAAATALECRDALETNAVLAGLRAYEKGPESVEDLISGALGREKARYERRLGFLATLASNAPYIGLFGTVLGIIRAFRDLSANIAEASSAVMGGIAEALVATAIGLLVAIPAVIAYNGFKARVKRAITDSEMLAKVLLSSLKAIDVPRGAQ
ncbi:MAG: MotA/TolQ/ExbB proton channel family protein [Pseudomonadota bacterium]